MQEFFKVTASLIVFILGALGLLTFARNFNKRPSVILTSSQCSPPCWYGIIPGQSTTSHVYAVMVPFLCYVSSQKSLVNTVMDRFKMENLKPFM